MSKKHDIMNDVESEFDGLSIDEDAVEGILCDGDGCRHSECECWSDFEKACEANLDEQRAKLLIGTK